MTRFICWVIGLTLCTNVVQADQIRASDPEHLLEFLKSEGIMAKLGKDDYGDPNIRSKYYNTNFSVYFYGCSNNVKCKSLQFYSGYRTSGSWPQDQANLWNAERRFAKAYVNDQGHARLEMDVFLGDVGIQKQDFAKTLAIWTKAIGDFEETIEW